MKNKASHIVKQIVTGLAAAVRAKRLAMRSKIRAFKARLVIFSLLHNRKILVSSLSRKLEALTSQTHDYKRCDDHPAEEEGGSEGGRNETVVAYNSNALSSECLPSQTHTHYEAREDDSYGYGDDGDDKYPDLTHTLFDSQDLELENPGGSVIEMVKHSKEDRGEEFRLEDEIDRVADLFIKRFHRQMYIQKQLSLKRNEEMLE